MWGKSPHIFYYLRLWSNVNADLEQLVVEELEPLGFELVELRLGGSRARPSLHLRIDRIDEGKITVDDCARASRTIEARLDREQTVGARYALEVSSPGVERSLRRPSDWRRFAGRTASVVSDELGGRAEVEILGVVGEEDEPEQVRVRTSGGEERSIALAGVREARLVFNWK